MDLEKLGSVDEVHRNQNCYSVNENGVLTALSLTESKTESLRLDKESGMLEYLNLSGNTSLKDVSFEGPLPLLQYLDVSNCALGQISFPPGFDSLGHLYLQKNQLEKLDFEADCPELVLLDAANNQLTEFSLPEGFKKLAYLYLPDNKIEGITFKTELLSLSTLHLKNNKLVDFPDRIIFTSPLETLCLSGSTPKNIPAVFLGDAERYSPYNCLKDAKMWFDEIQNNPSEKNRVVKLMITGNSDTGKSTLICALKNPDNKCKCPTNHDSTHGINIERIEDDEVEFNIWDFGGQEIYHGTHRLFMSAKSLQVIVFDHENENKARNHEPVQDRIGDEQVHNQPIQYWYETARELSPESRYIFVQNK